MNACVPIEYACAGYVLYRAVMQAEGSDELKRPSPLRTEEVKLVLKPRGQGVFPIKPKTPYLDENSEYETHEPESITTTVKELRVRGWSKVEA